MKKIKYLIFTVIVIMGLVAGYIYFVTGVSAVYSPIRQYQYLGSADQFIVDVKKYSLKEKNVRFAIKDTVGNEENGYAVHMTLSFYHNGHNIEYYLKCENIYNKRASESIIKLVGAFDKTNNTGGYSDEAEGIEALVGIFDSALMQPIRDMREEHQ